MPIAQLHDGVIAHHPDRRVRPWEIIHLQGLSGKVVDDSDLLRSQGAPVGEYLGPCFAEKGDVSLGHHRAFLPEPNQLLIVVQYGVRVLEFRRGIDGLVILWRRDPWCRAGKTGVRTGVPLHGRPAVVPGAEAQDLQRLRLRLAALEHDLVVIQALHIPVLADGGIPGVGHTQLLTLEDVGGPPEQVDAGGQHLGGLLPIPLVVPEAGHGPGLVVIAPEHRVPASGGLHLQLPSGQ